MMKKMRINIEVANKKNIVINEKIEEQTDINKKFSERLMAYHEMLIGKK